MNNKYNLTLLENLYEQLNVDMFTLIENMNPNLPGHCRKACVFAPTRLIVPTRRQHQEAHKKICIPSTCIKKIVLTISDILFFMNLTAYDNSTIHFFNCHYTQRNSLFFIYYLNLLFMLYIQFCISYITI